MKNKYIDLVEQSFEFPQDEFRVEDGALYFHDIPMMDVIGQYGTPLKISYLPKISSQIQRAKRMFNVAMAKVDYQGDYHYCYCTKSSHFSFVLEEALKNDIHIETSSAFDFNLIESLYDSKIVDKDLYIICNGYKKDTYIANIAQFINDGWHNTIPILDNMPELDQLDAAVNVPTRIGIRIAAEEEPKFEFYTSRLGIRYKDIMPFYQEKLSQNKKFSLKMLHFFINTGIKDNAYYWNELGKCVNVYCNLKAVCPTLDSLNIGGGLPIKNSLGMDYDYEYMIEEVVAQIKSICNSRGVEEPNIFTEGSRGTQHLHRVRFLYRRRERSHHILHPRSQAAERPREMVHGRQLLHDHPPRYLGHQAEIHPPADKQVGPALRESLPRRPHLRQSGLLQRRGARQRHLPSQGLP